VKVIVRAYNSEFKINDRFMKFKKMINKKGKRIEGSSSLNPSPSYKLSIKLKKMTPKTFNGK